MNIIMEKLDGLIQYVLDFIHKVKGYVDDIIAFFEDLRDKIEGLLDYVESKIQSIEDFVGELKQHNEEGAEATAQ
ncbi:hypothetical protein CHU92_01800 [Flavobacterium cyanobacteriorum]|uniref:Uncharacterized protein n=1 Tax=Flavobacterium cyanobacteriorum TaxID=2022802 RepID=A0A255ZX37_9FLAO|nr:hypothetical protein [Flavobacterium cyanobacteriorum]OYQ45939.1 hypothetical protein CHU92_01800 [Flavobacterium cyanobacteriorum]